MMNKIAVIFVLSVLPIVGACAMSLKGSETEVLQELQKDFPLGTPKEKVVAQLKSDLDVPEDKIQHHDYGKEPLNTTVEGKNIAAYSWVEAILTEYRSVKKFFIKTTVVAKFFFDDNDKLIAIKVKLYHDGL